MISLLKYVNLSIGKRSLAITYAKTRSGFVFRA